MWWDVGWVQWAQDAAAGFLDRGEAVRSAFPAWHVVVSGEYSHNEHLVVVLTNSDLYVLRDAQSCRYLNYGQVLYECSVGSFNAAIGKHRRRKQSIVIEGQETYFHKDYADEALKVVAAGTDASTRGVGHD